MAISLSSKLPKVDYYENPELIRTFRGNGKGINKVAFNPNLKCLASAGEDGSVRVWNFKAEMRPLKFDFHNGPVHTVSFNDDGSYLASGGADGKICITKNNAKSEGIQFKGHSAPVKSVAYNKDGNRLLTSADDKVIKLWSINHKRGMDGSRKVVGHDFVRSFTGHTDWVLDAKFSPDNRLVGSVCTKSVRLWDINTGQEVVRFKNPNLFNTSISFHPDGNYIAVGTGSKHLKIWDMRSQKLVQDYQLPTEINAVDFHPSGAVVACANRYDPLLNNSSLSMFDIRQSRCIFEIEGIHDTLDTVAFSHSGEYFSAAGKNKLVYVWKSNLDLKPTQHLESAVAEREILAKAANEINIGGAISLEKQMEAYANREQNEVYEKISTNLENLVLKINNISE